MALHHTVNRPGAESRAYSNCLEIPAFVRLRPNLVAVVFELMKMLPARYMLSRAEASGKISPGATIVESSSGTFATALAICCIERPYQLHVVTDPLTERYVLRRLRRLGATVEVLSGQEPAEGWQTARLRRTEQLHSELPGAHWPRQYSNPANRTSYARLAELVIRAVGLPDVIVGAVGSGGSLCGTAEHLELANSALRTVAVDTTGSVIFGANNGPRLLRGVGNSITPPNVRFELIDEVHVVTAAEATWASNRLEQRYGIFTGGSGGAAFLVADHVASNHEDRLVAFIVPDTGHRYFESIHDPTWLTERGVHPLSDEPKPEEVERMPAAVERWITIPWRRRSVAQVQSDNDANRG